MRTARGGYCEERGSEDIEERERDKERPGSLQQPSVTPAHPGTKSNLSLERNVQVCPREGLQNKAELQVVPRRHSCRREFSRPGLARLFRR